MCNLAFPLHMLKPAGYAIGNPFHPLNFLFMKTFTKFVGAALVGAFALLAAPAARAQVGVSVNIGAPDWGPPVPYGVQYYYIPEIDGYYDLYSQQYIVLQDGYWVPLLQLHGYDPYLFHPVVVNYRGREPWQLCSYYHSRYAYRSYQPYGRPRDGYYTGGYGRPVYGRGFDNRYYGNRAYYGGRDRDDYDRDDNRGYGNRDYDNRGDWRRDNRGYNNGQNQNGGQNQLPNRGGFGDNRGNQTPGPQPSQPAPRRSPGSFEQGRSGQGPQSDGDRRDGRGRR